MAKALPARFVARFCAGPSCRVSSCCSWSTDTFVPKWSFTKSAPSCRVLRGLVDELRHLVDHHRADGEQEDGDEHQQPEEGGTGGPPSTPTSLLQPVDHRLQREGEEQGHEEIEQQGSRGDRAATARVPKAASPTKYNRMTRGSQRGMRSRRGRVALVGGPRRRLVGHDAKLPPHSRRRVDGPRRQSGSSASDRAVVLDRGEHGDVGLRRRAARGRCASTHDPSRSNRQKCASAHDLVAVDHTLEAEIRPLVRTTSVHDADPAIGGTPHHQLEIAAIDPDHLTDAYLGSTKRSAPRTSVNPTVRTLRPWCR